MEIVTYSQKSFVVIGDTKTYKEELRALGGKYNSRLACGPGYVFANTHMENVKEKLGDRIIDEVSLEDRRKSPESKSPSPSNMSISPDAKQIPSVSTIKRVDTIEEKKHRFKLLINRAKKLNKKLNDINEELSELYNNMFDE